VNSATAKSFFTFETSQDAIPNRTRCLHINITDSDVLIARQYITAIVFTSNAILIHHFT